MRFKEATPENSGCDEGGGLFRYPNTAKFHGKETCPSGRLRCCLFCEMDCGSRCEVARVMPNQPKHVLMDFDCPWLKPSDELAWKYLLGPNVPDLRKL